VLRGSEKDRLEQLTSQIRMHVPECNKPAFDYLATLQTAISGTTIIEVGYCNNNGISSKRLLEPIGLVFYGYAWHIIAWCHLRNEYRDFKVARITKLTDTGSPFKKQPHITLNEYIAGLQLSHPHVV
jgi:predicted DNA-binding transcriptional regulator YafY